MATPSVRAQSPPDQEARTVIRSWRTEGYRIDLEDTGDGGALIVCIPDGEPPRDYGRIEYDAAKGHHVIEWSRDGCLALEQYKRDAWDSKFHSWLMQRRREGTR